MPHRVVEARLTGSRGRPTELATKQVAYSQHIVSLLRVGTATSGKGTYGVEDTVDVERRIDGKRGVHDVVPHIASGVCFDTLAG